MNINKEMIMIKCKNADAYQAKYPPKCGCEFCRNKWDSIARARARKKERETEFLKTNKPTWIRSKE